MYKFFEKLLEKPRLSLAVLAAVTLISVAGIFLLEYDNSYETGMPQGDHDYIIGEQTKKLFKDTETYLLLSIEPAEGRKLLSYETFRHMNRIVDEISEYRKFNQENEDARLKAILEKTGITILPEKTNPEIQDNASADDANKVKTEPEYPEPARKRNIYDYNNYKEISYSELSSVLDPVACDTLDTIINALEIVFVSPDEKIQKKTFVKILEAWEDIYLYKSVEIVEVFSNPIELSDINGADDTLRSVNFIEKDENGKRILPSTEKDFEIYRQKLEGNPVFKYNYYSPGKNGEVRALAASLLLRRQQNYDQFMNYFWAMIRKYDKDPVHMYLQGGLVFDKFINDFNQRDLQKYIPLVLLVVILTFYFNFRTVRGVVLPTLTVIIATIITMGIMGFLGIKLTMVSTLLPPIIIATGSSYSIRIFNQHLLDLEDTHKMGKLEGLTMSLYKSFPTVFLAGLTTFIGFMTMFVNRIPALSALGLYAAVGTALSVIVSIILLLCALYLMKLLPVHLDSKGEKTNRNSLVSATVDFCSNVTLKYHTQIIILAVITVIISSIGITKMTTETSATSFFKTDSYLRKSLSRTNELFKGTYIVNIIFSPGEGKSIYDHDFLKYIEEVRQWLDQPGQDTEHRILYNSGFGDFIKRMNMAMNNEDPAFYTIPDSMTILDYMELFSGDDDNGDGRPDMFETTISPNSDKTNLMVRIGTYGDEVMTTKKSQMTLDYISSYLNSRHNPGGYTYLVTGGPTNFNIVSKYIVQGQIEAIFLSITIIFILMFLLYRNFGAGIISMVPVSITVVWIFGIMGFSGIPLGMAQSLVASIAIGIGVDDTIQFTIILRRNLRNGMDLRSAVRAAHLEAGLAMIYTSLSLFWGFSIFIFSHFTPIQESGMLVSGVMLFCTMANLILLPSLVLTFRLHIHRIINWKIFNLVRVHYLLDERDVAEG
ncbi:MAG TPA: MMPL family transporter [Spirochaetota bacterium]|nr:MMPL family transporter [Spirochaetota bacterium]